MARLAGKVAVITGGSSGIGLAPAQRWRRRTRRAPLTIESAVADTHDASQVPPIKRWRRPHEIHNLG
jgi:NAD(P)-dependent dehydrogenase (short-subunit alcohol dehydrogenase family)